MTHVTPWQFCVRVGLASWSCLPVSQTPLSSMAPGGDVLEEKAGKEWATGLQSALQHAHVWQGEPRPPTLKGQCHDLAGARPAPISFASWKPHERAGFSSKSSLDTRLCSSDQEDGILSNRAMCQCRGTHPTKSSQGNSRVK